MIFRKKNKKTLTPSPTVFSVEFLHFKDIIEDILSAVKFNGKTYKTYQIDRLFYRKSFNVRTTVPVIRKSIIIKSAVHHH